jgi:hypothetical protein
MQGVLGGRKKKGGWIDFLWDNFISMLYAKKLYF